VTTLALDLPSDALVVLVGVAGSGKSTLAERLFAADQILSSDAFRAEVAGDPADQSATPEAFRRLHAALEERLRDGRLTAVDATNVQESARQQLLAAARRYGRPTTAIVLALPVEVALGRNGDRERLVPSSAIRRQDWWLRNSLAGLAAEGFGQVVVLTSADKVAALEIRAQRNAPKEQHRNI